MPNIPPASPNTPLVGFSLPDGASRVYYLSPQSDVISPLYDVIELAWIGSSWVSNNITSLAGASLVSSINALAGFCLPDGASRVYCFDNQNHVIELAWVGHWVSNDLMEIATPQ
jgi:hypothetical protein